MAPETTLAIDDDISLEHEVRALRNELAELRERLDQGQRPPAAPVERRAAPTAEPVTDRRQLLRRAGVAAAATVAGGTALAMSQASPAAAANGQAVIIGNTGGSSNTGSATTELRASNNTGSMGLFVVQDGSLNFTLFPAAIQGLATSGAVLHGVYGYTNQADGTGVVGIGDTGVFASGGDADLRLGGIGSEPNTTADNRGGMVFTTNDNLWFSTSTTATGWRKLAGPGTAGSLHVLDDTTRVYDSRPGTQPAVGLKTKFASGGERVIDCTVGGAVPTGAKAVMINATATNTNPGGFFAFFRNGIAWPNNSSLNWGVANTTVATTTVVAIDAAARFKAHMEGAGGADLIIDVIGYYQ